MERDDLWTAVLERDATRDGAFVYAVNSTGIYCRPSCPSRKPRREQVRFYFLPAEAEAAGFRPCLRCHPAGEVPDDPNVALMGEVCRYLEQCDERIPTLDELSARFGLSPYHLQRTFKRIVGVSPRQYAGAYRQARFKTALKDGADVTEAVYHAGYGSGSSAYEESRNALGHDARRVIGKAATKWRLHMRWRPAPWVGCLSRRPSAACAPCDWAMLRRRLWPTCGMSSRRRPFSRNTRGLQAALAQLAEYLEGREPHFDLPLDVQATAFQQQVWAALQRIPYGATRSYQEVARAIGRPSAVRAVAGACAHNPVALVVPCHRVVRSDGELGGYRWGIDRKRALLEQEALHASQAADSKDEPR